MKKTWWISFWNKMLFVESLDMNDVMQTKLKFYEFICFLAYIGEEWNGEMVMHFWKTVSEKCEHVYLVIKIFPKLFVSNSSFAILSYYVKIQFLTHNACYYGCSWLCCIWPLRMKISWKQKSHPTNIFVSSLALGITVAFLRSYQ